MASRLVKAIADQLGEKPDDPVAHVTFKECRRVDGSTYHEWYRATDDDGVTLSELAQRAYRQSEVPAFTPTFGPPATAAAATAPDRTRAYQARVRVVYDVRFELNGSPMTLDGLPTGLSCKLEQHGRPGA